MINEENFFITLESLDLEPEDQAKFKKFLELMGVPSLTGFQVSFLEYLVNNWDQVLAMMKEEGHFDSETPAKEDLPEFWHLLATLLGKEFIDQEQHQKNLPLSQSLFGLDAKSFLLTGIRIEIGAGDDQIPIRIVNALIRNGLLDEKDIWAKTPFVTLDRVVSVSEAQLEAADQIGKKSISRIKAVLRQKAFEDGLVE